MEFALVAIGVAAGAVVAWIVARYRHGAVARELASRQDEVKQERGRVEDAQETIRRLSESKARAEQSADRVPDLEGQLRELQEACQRAQVHAAELAKQREADAEKLRWVETAEARLREVFEALASRSLQNNTEGFLKHAREQMGRLLTEVRGDWGTQKEEMRNLVEPLGKTVHELDRQVQEMEQKREGAYQGLQEQLRQLGPLVQALRAAPNARGRWGELQLRRVVEMADMVSHVDFEEQAVTDSGRPDMIVHLPTEGILPVDSKTPMQAYLEALEDGDGTHREAKLREHVTAIRGRIRELSQKRYWEQFDRAPEVVVMFVPNDACLSAAFEKDGDLLEYAMQQRVLPTTPVTLLALLKTVAYGWQQHKVAENAREIAEQGRELHDRLAKFVEHFQRAGSGLDNAVRAYNDAVGSLESRLFPAARRFKELGAASADVPVPPNIDRSLRAPGQLTLGDMEDEDRE